MLTVNNGLLDVNGSIRRDTSRESGYREREAVKYDEMMD